MTFTQKDDPKRWRFFPSVAKSFHVWRGQVRAFIYVNSRLAFSGRSRCGEMADAQDLKSWDRKKSCEFESHHRHHLLKRQ